jgi:membrane protein
VGVAHLQWPLVLALISTALGGIYYFGPDAEQDWVWVSPGAVVGTVLWLVVSLAFKLYVATFTNYNASYGTVGGVIVLMLWFYLSGIALVLGAEINATIEHASPYGKAPGQKSPAGKRLLGARTARAFGSHPVTTPAPEPLPVRPAPSPALGLAFTALILFARARHRRSHPVSPSDV